MRSILDFRYGEGIRIHAVGGRELKAAISSWLGRVGLGGSERRRVEELSKGNQQKLQFVGTVLHEPELLILDEPFAGLDPVNVELMRGLIGEYREQGRTVIFSTHMMEQAERLCDFILLINKGVKVIDGTLDQIRATYDSGAILVDVEGDGAFIDGLPCVQHVVRTGKPLEVTLHDGADPQELLEALVGRARVQRFEIKTPSLHETFVQLVGGTDE